ncbi:MAG: dTDP-glucose 4,6-dehydratase [Candidatus Woesebacteria bacterium GW2011_GWF1_46_13]|uniref:dTDP-glucose 4,6-dehydratase n=1 Tax=Candidatus Woesebacteria bacterium GW2011_GWF1_46_13 TaxID=1618602 RepID=A0A0G1NRY7_9BACT|nr:MAG: dTDP-glucose 4,6-dehydratase [Candidatus Woesebacteria bacterium GW2011_GWF1_46_13]
MKVLITGGAGFIGSNFVHYWLRHHPKDKIRVLDALTYAGNYENLRSLGKKIEFIKGDITNRGHLRPALKGVDAIVHYAAETHADRSVFDPGSFWRTNVEGTKILLEEAQKAKVPRFHHISTDEVMGELPLDSKTPP